MFKKPKVTRGEILLSIALGIGASLISLALLWNGIGLIEKKEEILPVSNSNGESVVYYATQHGAFSTQEAASALQKQFPQLNKSVIFQVGETYHLWSSLFVSKTTLETSPASFSKKILVSSNSCEDPQIAALPKLLQDDNVLKNNIEASKLPADWETTIKTISTLTTDVAEQRLLILEHYRQQHSCLNISFD